MLPKLTIITSLFEKLSDEQKNVVIASNEHNVIVDSVAGCGKTTTSLALCQYYPHRKHLLLTYNSHLRKETETRAQQQGITNVEIHTYHSLCYKYFVKSSTDVGMQKVISEGLSPVIPLPNFDVIILDEAQDIVELLYSFVLWTIRWINNRRLTYVVLGDTNQSIYGFKGADSRYLSLADKLFVSDIPWIKLQILQSFRITEPISSFVNGHVLNNQRLVSTKPGPKVDYHFYDKKSRWDNLKNICYKAAADYNPEDIFVLSYSIRSSSSGPYKTSVQVIENIFTEINIPCYTPLDDDSELKQEYIAGKIVISTFHQSKGRERKCVIVVDMNDRLHDKIDSSGENESPATILAGHIGVNNLYYVATTRSLEKLIITQDSKHKPVRSTNYKLLKDSPYIDVKGDHVPGRKGAKPQKPRSVTSFLRFMTAELTFKAMNCFNVVYSDIPFVELKRYVPLEETTEDMSDVYGNAITMLNDMNHTRMLPVVYEELIGNKETRANYEDFMVELYNMGLMVNIDGEEKIYSIDPAKTIDVRAIVKTECFRSMMGTGFHSRWAQMKNNYGMVPHEDLRIASDIIDKIIEADHPNIPRFARTYEKSITNVTSNAAICMNGRIDIGISLSKVNEVSRIYEIKFTSLTTEQHILQLACYGYITNFKHSMTLLNILRGQRVDISIRPGYEKTFEDILVKHKNHITPVLSDNEFVSAAEGACKSVEHVYNNRGQ